VAPRNRFEEDPHRVIAFNQGDGVGRFHDGHVCSHAALAQMSVTSAGLLAKFQSISALTGVNWGGSLRR
jgi:hypothetical protein